MKDTVTTAAAAAAEPPESKRSTTKRNILIALLTTFLLVATIATTTITLSQKNTILSSKAHGLIKSTCASTFYPDLCVSSLVKAAPAKIKSPFDVIRAALDLAISSLKLNKAVVKKIASRKSLTKREISALKDCLETVDDSVEDLQKASDHLEYYASKNYTIDDLMTLLSATMTYQETCLDGFSHSTGDKKVRTGLISGQRRVFKLVSNVLAMVKKQYTHPSRERRLEETIDKEGWPEWLSAGDRRLLQSSNVNADVTVAADGSGNYRTVSEAVAAAPSGRTQSQRYVIRIKAGAYRENVEIPKAKSYLMFVGDGASTTIITASLSVGGGSTTFNSATVAVVGEGFLARGVTFQNTAGAVNEQAVALRVNSDFTAFYECAMIAFQDTLYPHSFRQFYVKCVIIGTVDFIFGNATVVLQDCDIKPRRPDPGQKNMVTAQGRDDANQNTGIVIQKCRISANSDLQGLESSFPSYLGRPWKQYSRTIIMQTDITNVIEPAGWYPWDGDFALDTLYYAEYLNTGAGANTSGRVTWGGYMVFTSSSQALPFTAQNFIQADNWLPATGFPYSPGL